MRAYSVTGIGAAITVRAIGCSFRPTASANAAVRAGLKVEQLKLTQGAPFWAVSVIHWMKERGWTEVSYEKPVVRNPFFSVFLLAFAAFDFVRMPFMSTSQMFVVLRKAEGGG